ncbi:malonyl-ACP O-methyltransferase BioC [Thiohalobacter thiocyanaticus]|uniref:Malonyl-[acyl-carrier protein] O-methyltransferase n=1 Tax=Thiohalobacter thiocyanaticus TaxID=585455 RepID=A0A426QK31_9GAMM|nr:malonyl-ACP O-methyltransferase BioC [Thiohalobacter thiocyanaticus]RRQ22108.1 malonyl-[acyl-carrier protein] O-methyltransferase BioC [Thiohalobacter thiocyanaticus]
MTDSPQQLDKRQVRLAFNRAAATYDGVAVLQREVGQRLLERLELIRLQPEWALDLGAGTGQITQALLRRYRGSRVLALDLAEAMLAQTRRAAGWWRRPRLVCGDAEQLPLADDSVDLLVSNLTLQWCNSLDRAFAEFRRVLRPGGALFFTTFGPDTLKEVRDSWAEVDGHSHTNRFIDMHDIGDALVRAGLAEPVMDVERLQLTYRDLPRLVREIKALGAHNVTAGRARSLTGRAHWRAFEQAYESRRRDGVLPVSYEVVYGHAWAPAAARQQRSGDEVRVPVDMLKRR